MSGRTSDTLIFLLVVGARFLIPRFPLPAIVACLIIDAADQTIFEKFTHLNLDNYQSYDKALDIYYLTVAYLSVIRNWTNGFAIEVARFLWYYRLLGVVAFEILEKRFLLFVFPNVFEYFFIAYEVVRTSWDPRRLTRKAVMGMAAFIWIVIKLPQEWWIHIAQNDFTDFMKESVLGSEPADGWAAAFANRPVVTAALVIGIAAVSFGVIRYARELPTKDWPTRFDVDARVPQVDVTAKPEPGLGAIQNLEQPPLRWPIFEKIILISLVSIIFTQMLQLRISGGQVFLGTAVVVALNAVLATVMARRGDDWTSLGVEFVVLAIGNSVVISLIVRTINSGQVNRGAAVFFGLLLTLLIVMYDRFRAVHQQRCGGLVEPALA